MVTTKLNLSMTEPQVRQIYAKQGDTGRVLDIALDQTPEDGTLRILRPDGVEATSEAVTGGEVESGGTFESLTEADVTELTVGIEPVQDLNGYDKPWVGGAGKNLFNIDRTEGTLSGRGPDVARSFDFGKFYVGLSANNYYSTTVVNSYSLVNNGVKVNAANRPYGIAFPMAVTVGTNYYVGYTQAPNQEYRVGFFDADGNYLSDSGARTQPSYFTPPASTATAVIVFTCTSAGENTDVTYANIQVEIGTNGSTWQPYSNICPITGHDEVTVTRAVLFPFDKNILSNATSAVKTVLLNAEPNTTYTASTTLPRNLDGNANIFFANSSTSPTSANAGAWEGYDRTFTTDADGIIQCLYRNARMPDATKTLLDYDYKVIEESTKATYTASLGQTVYGGTLDLVSGVLTVDKAMVDMGSLTWMKETIPDGRRFRAPLVGAQAADTDHETAICTQYALVATGMTYARQQGFTISPNGRGVYVYDVSQESATVSEFTTAVTGQQLVFELATPQTYTLTPQQIKTLVGTNNVWASSGDIVSITFTYGGLLSELPSDATEIVGKCYCDVEQNGVSSMPFTLNVKKNERES